MLGKIVELAYTQALWQFISTLAVSKVQNSSQQAKENAAMTLVYINALRSTLLMIMSNMHDKLFSINFVSAMAATKTDEEMIEFVQKQFVPLIKDTEGAMDSLPGYMDGIQPLVQMSSLLYHLRKDRHVYVIQEMHSMFCDKLNDTSFNEGIHKLIMSVIAALMTQSEQALRMYPILSGLGKCLLTYKLLK